MTSPVAASLTTTTGSRSEVESTSICITAPAGTETSNTAAALSTSPWNTRTSLSAWSRSRTCATAIAGESTAAAPISSAALWNPNRMKHPLSVVAADPIRRVLPFLGERNLIAARRAVHLPAGLAERVQRAPMNRLTKSGSVSRASPASAPLPSPSAPMRSRIASCSTLKDNGLGRTSNPPVSTSALTIG